jgi:ABC-2 type transport system ATP-binding protein
MDIIDEQRARGATVIFVTHQMEEVERLCDRIVLLKNGKAHAYGTVDAIKAQYGGATLDDIFVQIYNDQEQHDA